MSPFWVKVIVFLVIVDSVDSVDSSWESCDVSLDSSVWDFSCSWDFSSSCEVSKFCDVLDSSLLSAEFSCVDIFYSFFVNSCAKTAVVLAEKLEITDTKVSIATFFLNIPYS